MLSKIRELRDAKGAKAKEAVLRKYRDDVEFRGFLYYVLNPLLTYRLSEKTLRLKPGEEHETPRVFDDHLYDMCEYLSKLRGIDNETVRLVKDTLYACCTDPDDLELWIGLLSKTLRLGVTAKTVNKVIPGLIPEWEIQQAYPIDRYPIPEGTEFWLTQKLNGVRATLYAGNLIARSGQPYEGLDHILDAVGKFAERQNVVLDGELTLIDKGNLSDNGAFRIATGIINSDSGDKTAIGYTIFDLIPRGEFDAGGAFVRYGSRRAVLDAYSAHFNTDCTRVLPVLYHGTDQRKIWELLDQMVAEDKEGLMLNTDVPYYRKRHRGILKVKQFYTMDLPVVGIEEGAGRLKGTLGALLLDFKGNTVKVGSGFSDEQRQAYWQKRDEIAGMLCEVKYKEISTDKNTGMQSLQFPIFIRLRGDKSEVSYG